MPDLAGMDLGRRVYCRAPWSIYRRPDSWLYLSVPPGVEDRAARDLAIVSADHSRAEMYHAEEDNFRAGDLPSLTMFTSDQVLLASILADRQGCYLHSAGAILDGTALLFVGHSEAGKSTITRQLQAAGEAVPDLVAILCDDRNIVRRWDAHGQGPPDWRAYGTWSHGELPDVSPRAAPLRAILFIEKAPENALIPLSDRREVTRRRLACLIRAFATADWWRKSLTLVEQMAREVPCYSMRFDQSGEIVKQLRRLVG